MPPSRFNQKIVDGFLQGIQGCYEELLEEVRSGKHADVESAITFEIQQIEKVLLKVHITPDGELVERTLPVSRYDSEFHTL